MIIMRHLALMTAAWAGVLQVVEQPPVASVDSVGKLIGIASVLGTLTVLVYRLGVWRQEMENTKRSAVAQVKASSELTDRRLDAIDHLLADAMDRAERVQRWQTRIERRVERLERNESAEVVA